MTDNPRWINEKQEEDEAGLSVSNGNGRRGGYDDFFAPTFPPGHNGVHKRSLPLHLKFPKIFWIHLIHNVGQFIFLI